MTVDNMCKFNRCFDQKIDEEENSKSNTSINQSPSRPVGGIRHRMFETPQVKNDRQHAHVNSKRLFSYGEVISARRKFDGRCGGKPKANATADPRIYLRETDVKDDASKHRQRFPGNPPHVHPDPSRRADTGVVYHYPLRYYTFQAWHAVAE